MNAKYLVLVLLATVVFTPPIAHTTYAAYTPFQPVQTILSPAYAGEIVSGIAFLDTTRFAIITDSLEEDTDGTLRVYDTNNLSSTIYTYDFLPYDHPRALATGDFDNNGWKDIAVATNGQNNGVIIFWGTKSGSFSWGASYTNMDVRSLVTLSVNNQDQLGVTTDLAILIMRWDNSFVKFQSIPSYQPELIVSGDMDGDGDSDLLVNLTGKNDLGAQILWNTQGNFSEGPAFLRNGSHFASAIGIVQNKDGPSTLLLGYSTEGTIAAYTRDKTGAFSESITTGAFGVTGVIRSRSVCENTIVVAQMPGKPIMWFVATNGKLTNRALEPVTLETYVGFTSNQFTADGYYIAGSKGVQFLSIKPCNQEQPSIDVSLSGPETIRALETLEWKLSVKNPGVLPLTDIIISNIAPPEISLNGGQNVWHLPELKPGEIWTTTVTGQLRLLNSQWLTDTVIVGSSQISETQYSWVTEFDPHGLGLQAVLDIPSEIARGNTLDVSIWYEVVPDETSSYNPLLPITETLVMSKCFSHSTLREIWIPGWNASEAIPLSTTACEPGTYTGTLIASQNSKVVDWTETEFFITQLVQQPKTKLFLPIIIR